MADSSSFDNAEALHNEWLQMVEHGWSAGFWEFLTITQLRKFLKAGVNIHAKDFLGCTPLHHTARNENVEVIRELISLGADIHSKDKGGYTPLHWSAGENENSEAVECFITMGANINAKNNEGLTPLHMAAKANGNIEVVKMLIVAGADIHDKDNNGNTPYYYLLQNHSLKDDDKKEASKRLRPGDN